nr:MAG TPA: Heat shock protein hslJ.1, JCSG, Stress response, Structural [Caudoviricetes sp.]
MRFFLVSASGCNRYFFSKSLVDNAFYLSSA